MILQKIAQAIRRQDWFQVVIEVLIVIVGIFLALQVQAWYEDRSDREREGILLSRLHSEVQSAIDIVKPSILRKQQTFNSLSEVLDILMEEVVADTLTPLQCYSIYSSGMYGDQVLSLPTMVELTTSGQFSIIENENIKTVIINYSISQGRWKEMIDDIRADRMMFPKIYPEMIKLDLKMKTLPRSLEEINALNMVCNLDKMKASASFQNDLIDATGKNSAMINFFLSNELDTLENLHNVIDTELGITH